MVKVFQLVLMVTFVPISEIFLVNLSYRLVYITWLGGCEERNGIMLLLRVELPYVRHYCPLSNYKPHPLKNKLFFIFYGIFEQKFPHKKSKKQIEAADNRAAGTVVAFCILSHHSQHGVSFIFI